MQEIRLAIVDTDRCQPKKCNQECKRLCPVVRVGKLCVEVKKKAIISESLCIGCGICVNKCPMNAIKIINIPSFINLQTIHRFGPNGFKLCRLPTPRLGQVLGLVGTNGIGKSTALKILACKLIPNFGQKSSDWEATLSHFRGTEIFNYFTTILSDCKVLIKPQYVDIIPTKISGNVKLLLEKKTTKSDIEFVHKDLDLPNLYNKNISQLSGGELQRFAIATLCLQDARVYMFDEPSSYLDIKQRVNVARVIQKLKRDDIFVVCVEHDLSILDYLSDFVCVLYGQASAYGVVSLPFNVREGINIFLDGYIPTENMRFRDYPLTFKITDDLDINVKQARHVYPAMSKTFDNFKLSVESGSFNFSEITVLLGENGTGKSTFIQLISGLLSPDNIENVHKFIVSYKPQKLAPKFDGTVAQLFIKKLGNNWLQPHFKSAVYNPLDIEHLSDHSVKSLSGGELQRVAIVLTLAKPADIYLIDEPSAYLDSEQRMIVAKVIKRFVYQTKKACFLVEHDFIMASYLADKIVLFSGKPGVECVASAPQCLQSGMNAFLKTLNVTFRNDPTNFRPRINKLDSVNDREQKQNGNYFYLSTTD